MTTPRWSLRFGEALMPTVANGIDVDWNIARARAENLELELHPTTGLAVRLLGYANHANMGRYDEATQDFRSGRDPKPDVMPIVSHAASRPDSASTRSTRSPGSYACSRARAGTKGRANRLPTPR